MKIIPAGIPEKPVKRREPARGEYVITECGCVNLPWPVFTVFGVKGKDVLCDTHGWQAIVKPATLRDRAGIPETLPLPMEPGF